MFTLKYNLYSIRYLCTFSYSKNNSKFTGSLLKIYVCDVNQTLLSMKVKYVYGVQHRKYTGGAVQEKKAWAKGSQISEKYWGEVGKGKRVDVYLEVRKSRGHIFFEWNKCLCICCKMQDNGPSIDIPDYIRLSAWFQSTKILRHPADYHNPRPSYSRVCRASGRVSSI
jgi:hypothetical protein